jgi:hypothetical protein
VEQQQPAHRRAGGGEQVPGEPVVDPALGRRLGVDDAHGVA